MKTIFIDANAFVALADTTDSNHHQALTLSKILKKKNYRLCSSDFAFGEAVTVISQKLGHRKAIIWIEEFLQSNIIIERNSPKREGRAIEFFRQATTKNVRFTDCLNMAIMEERGIKEIFSFDKHYKKAGFRRLGID